MSGLYELGEEIEIVAADVEDIVQTIARTIGDPDKLKQMGEAGKRKTRTLYSFDRRLKPRIGFLEKSLETSSYRKPTVQSFQKTIEHMLVS